MLKKFLATSALTAVLATSAFAQTDAPDTEPDVEPPLPGQTEPAEPPTGEPAPADEPMAEEPEAGEDMPDPATEPAAEPAEPDMPAEPMTDDPAAAPADPAADPMADPAADPMADPAADPMADPAADPAMEADPMAAEEPVTPTGFEGMTAEELTGAEIQSTANENEVIATVANVVMGADGTVESIAAEFGGFLGFGSDTVLLTLEEVELMEQGEGEGADIVLQTALTPEDLEGRAPYEEE